MAISTIVEYHHMANTSAFELEFIIRNARFNIDFEEDCFADDEAKAIIDYVYSMSREMSIDKSYVECKDNKRVDVFMLESGWNTLKDILVDSRYGKHLHPIAQASLVEAFITMARCYIYECLAKFTEKFEHVLVDIDSSQDFEVVVCKDTSSAWKSGLGHWQDWDYDDDGNPIIGEK